MRLTQQQSIGIVARVIPAVACACTSLTHRIEPDLRELEGGPFVAVVCCGCGCCNLFSAAALGLVPTATDASSN